MIKIIVLSIGLVITIMFGFVIPSVFGELTTGDIAQFSSEQQRTYRMINLEISVLDFDLTKNNSTLSNDEIRSQIMEYFIVNGYTYCRDWNEEWNYCNDLDKDKSWENKLVRDKYIEIVKQNQPGPLDGLLNLFSLR